MEAEEVVEEEPRAVVFVCDRQGPALGRRERCLRLAGIPFAIDPERRPSGTYYKLYVRERDAVAAHLALQMGGCAKSSSLTRGQPGVLESLKDVATTLWEEVVLLFGRLVDLVREAPRLLAGPNGNGTRPSR